MRTLAVILAIVFAFSLAPNTASAERRTSTGVFGLFGSSQARQARRARIQRARKARRAQARRSRARRAQVRKARRARRQQARRSSARRRQARRSSVRRRATVRRSVRRARRPVVARRAAPRRAVASKFARTTVPYRTKQKPGTIVIETSTRHLFYVLPGNKAVRYGVAVGKQGFAWSGTSRVRRKVEWPTWTPPREMIQRDPKLARFAGGMPGGPQNPLGARALYLYQGKQDTLYRIHGTNQPGSIGSAASSGCIRMRNEDVAHLYAKVRMGAKVIVR